MIHKKSQNTATAPPHTDNVFSLDSYFGADDSFTNLSYEPSLPIAAPENPLVRLPMPVQNSVIVFGRHRMVLAPAQKPASNGISILTSSSQPSNSSAKSFRLDPGSTAAAASSAEMTVMPTKKLPSKKRKRKESEVESDTAINLELSHHEMDAALIPSALKSGSSNGPSNPSQPKKRGPKPGKRAAKATPAAAESGATVVVRRRYVKKTSSSSSLEKRIKRSHKEEGNKEKILQREEVEKGIEREDQSSMSEKVNIATTNNQANQADQAKRQLGLILGLNMGKDPVIPTPLSKPSKPPKPQIPEETSKAAPVHSLTIPVIQSEPFIQVPSLPQTLLQRSRNIDSGAGSGNVQNNVNAIVPYRKQSSSLKEQLEDLAQQFHVKVPKNDTQTNLADLLNINTSSSSNNNNSNNSSNSNNLFSNAASTESRHPNPSSLPTIPPSSEISSFKSQSSSVPSAKTTAISNTINSTLAENTILPDSISSSMVPNSPKWKLVSYQSSIYSYASRENGRIYAFSRNTKVGRPVYLQALTKILYG